VNGGKAGAFVAAHKKELLLGGAGVAVEFGLHARSKGGSPATTTATTSGAPMPSASGTGFDSSSTDVYNALQPQIETTQRQLDNTQTLLEKLLEQLRLTPPKTPVKPKPKPKPKPKAKPKVPPRKAHPAHPAPRHVPPRAPHKPVQRVYTVRKGDNLTAVATRLGIRGGWHALYAANKVTIGSNANLIKPGQRLVY